ncbi:Lrp/AsnC family transcriptional regulator [Nocardioides sp. IC4_145]|uniref:Lrp/AsnC family transcriptional regulator n=1 Tax=Nocardioides sp. IC4_145 TaxID=2714037 RepID=UPI0014090E4F|nr:Lrp/AsnC family transcriptional regulator [Nocardioides sp. IC4_145]NHC24329.1 Lrp/AsnC family transcriptional regulator [Nocardioides sp. IC4_145]
MAVPELSGVSLGLPSRRVMPGASEESGLTEVELHLIDLLQADGRQSFADMARATGIAEKTVRRKVARLLEDRFITIVPVTDPAMLGYESMALVCIRVGATAGDTAALANRLAALPEVDYVTCTTGRFAVQAEVMCADQAELQRVVDSEIRTLPGVADVEVLPYLRLQYQQARFSGHRPASAVSAGIRPFQLDEVDRRIIARLCLDGRAPVAALAAELEASETKIRQRISRMTEQGATRVMAIANPLRLGYRAVGWMVLRVNAGDRLTEVAEGLTRLSAVSYLVITAGRYDLLVELVCRDREELLAVVDKDIRTLRGVSESEVWLYMDLHYKPLLPSNYR